ncbi:hypothetical protein PF003_g19942 [Phytophthora fragariae]|nr:hypothetical protein PF003_g19942 [Phytophthora fragariae]
MSDDDLSEYFSTFMHPVFYVSERVILGMHKMGPIATEDMETDDKMSYLRSSTPALSALDLESSHGHAHLSTCSSDDDRRQPTAITMSSIILPLVCYVKVFWTKLPAWEKLLCMPLRTFAPSPASMA